MTKKPIHAVISDVLQQAGEPMSAREVYEHINTHGLYEFNAKDPASIVRSQLRRHCEGVKGATGVKFFKMTGDGRFELAES